MKRLLASLAYAIVAFLVIAMLIGVLVGIWLIFLALVGQIGHAWRTS